MEYTDDELKFFTLWYQKAYAKRKKKPPKIEKELYDKLIVDIRELGKDADADEKFKDELGE